MEGFWKEYVGVPAATATLFLPPRSIYSRKEKRAMRKNTDKSTYGTREISGKIYI